MRQPHIVVKNARARPASNRRNRTSVELKREGGFLGGLTVAIAQHKNQHWAVLAVPLNTFSRTASTDAGCGSRSLG